MKWILIVVGAIAACVAIVAFIGSRLPLAHAASCRAQFRRPPQDVWAVITNFAAAPNWRSDLKGIERLPDRDGHPVWVEISRQGRMQFEVEEFVPNERLVTRISDPKLPFGGSWTYALAPASAGCTLTIREDGEVYNPIFRFMARYVFGHDGTMRKYLRDLGAKLGEPVVPERVL